jgi:hypothetical protein
VKTDSGCLTHSARKDATMCSSVGRKSLRYLGEVSVLDDSG